MTVKYNTRTRHFLKMIRVLNLPNATKATQLLLKEMTKEKGFTRHDGADYFIHPIAVAQVAIDFKIISNLIAQNNHELADTILASCLLHDIIEDVEIYTKELISAEFSPEIAIVVDNVSKRAPGEETMEQYLERVGSHPISALVKILDRLNNTATLSNSSLKHRIRQYEETTKYFLPLAKEFRVNYWEYGDLFYQAKDIMKALLLEVKRSIDAELKLEEVSEQTSLLTAYQEGYIFTRTEPNDFLTTVIARCPSCKHKIAEGTLLRSNIISDDLGPVEYTCSCPHCKQVISDFSHGNYDLTSFTNL